MTSLSERIVVGLAALFLMPGLLFAQGGGVPTEPPSRVPFRWGPLAVAPTLTLANLGWDSNVVLAGSDAEGSDVTATFRPELQSWVRTGPVRLRVRNRLDFVHFREHATERSVDGFHEGRLEVPLIRMTPYVTGRWVSARQRFAFEIDERTRRLERAATAGVELRLGLRTALDVALHRAKVEFRRAESLRDPLLTDYHDYTSHGESVAVRHELTPVTTAAFTISRSSDRFDLAPERDSEGVSAGTSLEFKPTGAVDGKVYVGWFRLRLVEPGRQSFGGLSTAVDLSYTLVGATRFTAQIRRDVSYSATRGQHAYLLAGGRLIVNHRLGDTWDVGVRLGRHRLSYGLFEAGTDSVEPVAGFGAEREMVTDYGGEVGYRVGPDLRLAFDIAHHRRGSTLVDRRDFARTRAGLSVTYRF